MKIIKLSAALKVTIETKLISYATNSLKATCKKSSEDYSTSEIATPWYKTSDKIIEWINLDYIFNYSKNDPFRRMNIVELFNYQSLLIILNNIEALSNLIKFCIKSCPIYIVILFHF
jgi:hypothetical protein